jgi:hypothetical protein
MPSSNTRHPRMAATGPGGARPLPHMVATGGRPKSVFDSAEINAAEQPFASSGTLNYQRDKLFLRNQ